MLQVPGSRHPGLALAAVALLGGCDALFGLKTTSAPPDAVPCGAPDEDGDCVANAVDNCPGIANPMQTQSGESDTPAGAGDACDPVPDRVGDAIAYFESFDDPTEAQSSWTGGSWTFSDGFAQNTPNGGYGYLRRTVIDDEADLTIEARFIYRSQLDIQTTRIGVVLDLPDVGSGPDCWVDPNALLVYAQETTPDPMTSAAVSIPISPLVSGDDILLVMRRDRVAKTQECAVTINGARSVLPVIHGTGDWPTMGRAAVQVRDSVAELHHVTLYTR